MSKLGKEYDAKVEKSQLIYDCMTLAFRLLGEDENTMSPECIEVMKRWSPICWEYINWKSGE